MRTAIEEPTYFSYPQVFCLFGLLQICSSTVALGLEAWGCCQYTATLFLGMQVVGHVLGLIKFLLGQKWIMEEARR